MCDVHAGLGVTGCDAVAACLHVHVCARASASARGLLEICSRRRLMFDRGSASPLVAANLVLRDELVPESSRRLRHVSCGSEGDPRVAVTSVGRWETPAINIVTTYVTIYSIVVGRWETPGSGRCVTSALECSRRCHAPCIHLTTSSDDDDTNDSPCRTLHLTTSPDDDDDTGDGPCHTLSPHNLTR